MLKIAGDLSSYALSAGEPFLMQVQLASAAGLAMDIADQSLVLTFYSPSNRAINVQLEGVRDQDATGEFFRFEQDGSFSEGLYGQFLRVELSRRYLHGRMVLGDGALSVAASAATVPSLDGAAIGDVTQRVTIRAAAQLGGPALVSVTAHPFEPMGVVLPKPTWSVPPSIASDGTPAVGEALTGSVGTIADGTVSARAWLLAGTAISGATGASYTPTQAGDYQFRVTAAGDGGEATATSAVVTVTAAPVVTPAPTTARLLIVAGQSQGMTPNTSPSTLPANIAAMPGATATTPGVRIWNPTTAQIEPYQPCVNSCIYARNGANEFYGPEAEIARLLLSETPGQQIVVVKLDVGSTPLQKGASFQNGTGGAANNSIIECWDPSLADNPNAASLPDRNINLALQLKARLDATVATLQAEGKTIERVGMVWLQGQNDAYFQPTAISYGNALSVFQTWARTKLLAGGDAPFVLSMCENIPAHWPYVATLRPTQTDFAAKERHTFTVETSDLAIGADGFHYAPDDVITLAQRLYAGLKATHAAVPTPTVTLSGAITQAEGNSGTTLYSFTVTRSTYVGAVAVPWSFAAGTTDASDYTGGVLPAGGTVTIADGQTTASITISVAGDTTVEADETFTVSIAAPAGYAAGANMASTGTITNDDSASGTRPPAAFDMAMTSPAYGAGKFGQALTGGYGEGAKIAATSSLTMECWFAAAAAPSGLKIFSGQVGVAILGVDGSGRLNAFVSIGGNQIGLSSSTAPSICDGAEHHIELDMGPAGCFLFQDGALIASNPTAFAALSPDFTQQPFSVRRCQVGTVGQYDDFGTIDAAVNWNVVRHTAAFTPSSTPYSGNEAGMLNLYQFDGSGAD